MTDESAGQRGHQAIATLVEHGRKLGLVPVIEYPVPGGRIDVVWLWTPPFPIPGLVDPLPVVGFEVESSWRTRKHIKGDLINLQDLACSLGVIVLLGDGSDVESTQKFASQLVDRPGCRIVVWSGSDLDDLASGTSRLSDSSASSRTTEQQAPAAEVTLRREHHGKYRALWKLLVAERLGRRVMTFDEIEHLIGFTLPSSCRKHLAHWYGYENTAVGRAIRDAGCRARQVNLVAETVEFEREANCLSVGAEEAFAVEVDEVAGVVGHPDFGFPGDVAAVGQERCHGRERRDVDDSERVGVEQLGEVGAAERSDRAVGGNSFDEHEPAAVGEQDDGVGHLAVLVDLDPMFEEHSPVVDGFAVAGIADVQHVPAGREPRAELLDDLGNQNVLPAGAQPDLGTVRQRDSNERHRTFGRPRLT